MTETTSDEYKQKIEMYWNNIKETLKIEENVPDTWASLGILDPESYFGAPRTLLVSHSCCKISSLREVIRK